MMNNPFQNLNRAMKNTVFKDVTFSNERKEAVKEAIRASIIKQSFHHGRKKRFIPYYSYFNMNQRRALIFLINCYNIMSLAFNRMKVNYIHCYTYLRIRSSSNPIGKRIKNTIPYRLRGKSGYLDSVKEV